MLSNDYFYFGSIRKYISLFGSMFNNIIINRTDKQGNITQIINVPISYAQKEKMMIRMKQDPAIDKQSAIILPRMSFYLDGITYAPERKQKTTNKIFYPNSAAPNSPKFTFEEVPYDFHFSLYVYIKNAEDGTKIIEQILPFFTPEFTVRANMIPNHQSFDIPVIMKMISHENTDTTNFADNSVLIWTLNFTVKGSLFGPIRSSTLITDFANTSVYFGSFDEPYTTIVNEYGLQVININTPISNTTYLDGSGNAGYISISPNTAANTADIYFQDWSEIINIEEAS